MAWLGVPFTSAAAWRGFNLTEPRFWNQFITAQETRLEAFPDFLPGVAVPVVDAGAILTHAGPPGEPDWPTTLAVNLNTFRGFWPSGLTPYPNLLNGITWGIRSNVVDGAEFNDFLALDYGGSGLVTQAFVDRINTILDDAGCPPMGTTVLSAPGEAATLGIPWTRKHGLKGALSTGYGRVQPGDVIGRHIFNELWAFLTAMDCVIAGGTFSAPGVSASYADQEYATATGSGVDSTAAIADMLTNWTGVNLGGSGPPSASVTFGSSGPVVADGQRNRARATWTGLAVPHASTATTPFWVPAATSPGFVDHDADGKEVGKVWWAESATAASGSASSSIRGTLSAPTSTPGGYIAAPFIALAMAFPDP